MFNFLRKQKTPQPVSQDEARFKVTYDASFSQPYCVYRKAGTDGWILKASFPSLKKAEEYIANMRPENVRYYR